MLKKEELETSLARVHDWIKSADQKVGIFLAFQGVVITLLFKDIFSWIKTHSFSCSEIFISLLGSIFIAISAYKLMSAIIPRISKPGNGKSVIFFGDISSQSLEKFKKKIKQLSAEEFEDDLAEQIYVCSGIATRKHVEFKEAILYFVGGLLLFFLLFLISKI